MSLLTFINKFYARIRKKKEDIRGHPGLNRGPLDLQSNALPLSYIPLNMTDISSHINCSENELSICSTEESLTLDSIIIVKNQILNLKIAYKKNVEESLSEGDSESVIVSSKTSSSQNDSVAEKITLNDNKIQYVRTSKKYVF